MRPAGRLLSYAEPSTPARQEKAGPQYLLVGWLIAGLLGIGGVALAAFALFFLYACFTSGGLQVLLAGAGAGLFAALLIGAAVALGRGLARAERGGSVPPGFEVVPADERPKAG